LSHRSVEEEFPFEHLDIERGEIPSITRSCNFMVVINPYLIMRF
jgi:hypothetical protein